MPEMTKEKRQSSFITSRSMPWKLLKSKTAVVDGYVRPEHIKLYPTNRCNAACSFCGLRERSMTDEFSSGDLLEVARHFHRLGTKAITVAGGGEPTLHPALDDFLQLSHGLGIKLGIITNGLIWSGGNGRLPANGQLTWARMSVVDPESGTYDVNRLHRLADNLPDVALSIYFTVTKMASAKTALAIADIVESHPRYSHIKFAEDSKAGAPRKMDEFENMLSGRPKSLFLRNVLDTPPSCGTCWLSLLRPVIAADGYVYPCCNTGADAGNLTLQPESRMGRWRDFGPHTPPFNADFCPLCQWDQYNEVLDNLLASLEHEDFL